MGAIGLINFKIGQAIQAGYINASGERISLGLADADDTLLFIFEVWYDDKILVLNTRKYAVWGKEDRPSSYDFTPEKSITVEILATELTLVLILMVNTFTTSITVKGCQ